MNLGWQVQGSPSQRAYATEMVTWDGADGYVLLFGGSNYTGVYEGDTWTFSQGAWTELTPPVAPVGRDSAALVFDPTDNYVVLFGGYTPQTGGQLNDTWTFRAGAWQLDSYASAHGPSPRWGFTMTFDAATDYVLLFGGGSGQCLSGGWHDCNDTWRFVYGDWTRLSSALPAPPAREQAAMTYDARDGYPILFGGAGPYCIVSSGNLCQDTWKWNASGYLSNGNWTQVKSGGVLCGTQAEGKCAPSVAPGERRQIQLAFDVADNEVILFGGYNSSVDGMGDTWSYVSGVWTKLSPAGNTPWGRWGGGLAYDGTDGYLMLWGGGEIYYTPVDMVWKFSAGNWTEVTPGTGPPEEAGGNMAWDPADGYVVYFGGYNVHTSGYLQETWTYIHGVWSQLPIPGPSQPVAREYGSMVWDATDGYLVLFGGLGPTGLLNDTWAFVHGTWTEECSGGGTLCGGLWSPSPRWAAGIAYNPNDGYVEMFGGEYFFPSRYLNDTWLWFAGAWYNETLPTHAPSERAHMGMVWDAVDNEIVLFGGGNFSGAHNDTWVLQSYTAGWSQLGSCGGYGQAGCYAGVPSARSGMIYFYDSVDQVVVVSSGISGVFSGSYQAYTYVFRGGTWTGCPSLFCLSGFAGWSTYATDGASTFDPVDGYGVARSGYVPFGQYGGSSYLRDTWVFGPLISAPAPLETPYLSDAGQPENLAASATGGGFGTLNYEWNGLPATGCSRTTSTGSALTCTSTPGGYTEFAGAPVYGWYYALDNVITDSNGFPGITTYTSQFSVALDPVVFVNSSASEADVGQSVYFGMLANQGWGPLAISWNDLPPGCALVASTGNTELEKCTLHANSIGAWQPAAMVVDATGFVVDSSPLALTVYPAASAGGIGVNRVALDAGQTFSADISPSGGSGSYSFAWTGVPAACLSDSAVLSCTVPANEAGSYTPSVTVRDSLGETFSEQYAGVVVVSPAPAVTGLTADNSSGDPVSAADVGQTVTFRLAMTPGSGGDTIGWNGLPTGCSASGTQASSVVCLPTASGVFAVSATVNDSNGVTLVGPTFTLTVSPALSGSVSATATQLDVGQSEFLASSVSGGSGGLRFLWRGLPAGCTAAGSATVSCSPTAAGSSTPSVTVWDSNDGSVQLTLSSAVTVSPSPTATKLSVSTASGTPTGSVVSGTSVTFSFTLTPGAGGDTVVWSGLPGNCSPASSNATSVACAPTGAGTYWVSATVTDANGGTTTTATVAVTVTEPPASTPFASSFQWLELGLIVVFLVIAGLGVLLLARRLPVAARRFPSETSSPPPSVVGEPPGTPAPSSTSSWDESHEPPTQS
jgi:hypothetical protein